MLDMIGLTDEVLPLLVEFNPMITVEILMIILKNKNNETIEKYLRQITNINVTLQSLEGKRLFVDSRTDHFLVVNRLVTQVELPSDFIPYYITRCRKTCEDLEVSCSLLGPWKFCVKKTFDFDRNWNQPFLGTSESFLEVSRRILGDFCKTCLKLEKSYTVVTR